MFSSPAPLWPFGHGLSYTTFKYSDLRIETPAIAPDAPARVSFTLANTGRRAGREVTQVYVRDEYSSVTTPVMKLAAFTKVALGPGEQKRISLEIVPGELALWNTAMKRVVEPGKFAVMVGSSAESIHLRGEFEVVAVTATSGGQE